MPYLGAADLKPSGGILPPKPGATRTPPIIPRESRSEGWMPPGVTPGPGPLEPKTDPATDLPGLRQSETYRNHTFTPVIKGGQRAGWIISGQAQSMSVGPPIPLMTFPADADMARLREWVDARMAKLEAADQKPSATTAAKQAALPATDGKGLPSGTATPPATESEVVAKTPMSTGAKVAIGAGAGILALLAFKG